MAPLGAVHGAVLPPPHHHQLISQLLHLHSQALHWPPPQGSLHKALGKAGGDLWLAGEQILGVLLLIIFFRMGRQWSPGFILKDE